MRPERKVIRLADYDYSQNGVYAITICVHERRSAFGRMENGEMKLGRFGCVADENWRAVSNHYASVTLDEWVVMPNHFHGILFIECKAPLMPNKERELRQFSEPIPGSLSAIIANYKSGVSRCIGEIRECKTKVWQRGFYEHIIRNARDLELQRQYIRDNPAKWADDELFS